MNLQKWKRRCFMQLQDCDFWRCTWFKTMIEEEEYNLINVNEWSLCQVYRETKYVSYALNNLTNWYALGLRTMFRHFLQFYHLRFLRDFIIAKWLNYVHFFPLSIRVGLLQEQCFSDSIFLSKSLQWHSSYQKEIQPHSSEAFFLLLIFPDILYKICKCIASEHPCSHDLDSTIHILLY